MIKIPIIASWCAGSHGHDCGEIESEIEFTKEQLEAFKELEAYDEELNLIDDPRLSEDCQVRYHEMLDEMYEVLTDNGLMDAYEEDCRIDEDSLKYDPNGEEEQYTKEPFEYFMDVYCPEVRFMTDEDELSNLEKTNLNSDVD